MDRKVGSSMRISDHIATTVGICSSIPRLPTDQLGSFGFPRNTHKSSLNPYRTTIIIVVSIFFSIIPI